MYVGIEIDKIYSLIFIGVVVFSYISNSNKVISLISMPLKYMYMLKIITPDQ